MGIFALVVIAIVMVGFFIKEIRKSQTTNRNLQPLGTSNCPMESCSNRDLDDSFATNMSSSSEVHSPSDLYGLPSYNDVTSNLDRYPLNIIHKDHNAETELNSDDLICIESGEHIELPPSYKEWTQETREL